MTSQNTRRFDEVRPGDTLPELAVPITVALIASGAIATRDYFPGHHDKDAARALGTKKSAATRNGPHFGKNPQKRIRIPDGGRAGFFE